MSKQTGTQILVLTQTPGVHSVNIMHNGISPPSCVFWDTGNRDF